MSAVDSIAISSTPVPFDFVPRKKISIAGNHPARASVGSGAGETMRATTRRASPRATAIRCHRVRLEHQIAAATPESAIATNAMLAGEECRMPESSAWAMPITNEARARMRRERTETISPSRGVDRAARQQPDRALGARQGRR